MPTTSRHCEQAQVKVVDMSLQMTSREWAELSRFELPLADGTFSALRTAASLDVFHK